MPCTALRNGDRFAHFGFPDQEIRSCPKFGANILSTIDTVRDSIMPAIEALAEGPQILLALTD